MWSSVSCEGRPCKLWDPCSGPCSVLSVCRWDLTLPAATRKLRGRALGERLSVTLFPQHSRASTPAPPRLADAHARPQPQNGALTWEAGEGTCAPSDRNPAGTAPCPPPASRPWNRAHAGAAPRPSLASPPPGWSGDVHILTVTVIVAHDPCACTATVC